MDIGQFGQKVKPKLATKLKAVDLLNQMEGVYITKVEAKAVQVVELVIVTTPDIVDGKLVEGTSRLQVNVITLVRPTSRHRSDSATLRLRIPIV